MRTFCTVIALTFLASCSHPTSYSLNGSTKQINELQILDLDAQVNNDGITRELQGDYAKFAAENYRNSIYTSKEGRDVKTKSDKE